jgi:hypothetical protein
MQAALEEDALGAAVGFYSEALPLLRKYGHRGAFRGIAAEADAAARQVSLLLAVVWHGVMLHSVSDFLCFAAHVSSAGFMDAHGVPHWRH